MQINFFYPTFFPRKEDLSVDIFFPVSSRKKTAQNFVAAGFGLGLFEDQVVELIPRLA